MHVGIVGRSPSNPQAPPGRTRPATQACDRTGQARAYHRAVRLAYNTNGLAHHRLDDALALVADLGYEGVALTLDVGHLDPATASAAEVERVARRCDALGLAVAVETGARFVLDPRRKHFPTLMEEAADDRERRVAFLARCGAIARDLGARVVSIWAGAAPDSAVGDARDGDADEALWSRLVDGVVALLERTDDLGVRWCFEPEPGMFVERPAGYLELVRRLAARGHGGAGGRGALGLTLDVGHLLCTGDVPVSARIEELAAHLEHVHLDDIAGGVHEHRMLGEGDLDLAATLDALDRVGFEGLAAVELSRDSHRGAWAAREALVRLRAATT